MNQEFNDGILRRWWLRHLDEPSAQALEERLLGDAELAARAQDAEHDLYDDHVRGRLDAAESTALTDILSADPTGRERLRLARALTGASERFRGHLARTVTGRHRWRRIVAWAGALAACAVLVFVAAGWVPYGASPNATTHDAGAVVQLTLLADAQRGAQTQAPEVVVPRGAATLRVQAEVAQPDAAARYVLSVESAGKILASAPNLALQHAGAYIYVEAELPAAAVAGGACTVSVRQQNGIGPATAWPVRIETGN